jgi:soluble lytic murein transglycosylase-like protein
MMFISSVVLAACYFLLFNTEKFRDQNLEMLQKQQMEEFKKASKDINKRLDRLDRKIGMIEAVEYYITTSRHKDKEKPLPLKTVHEVAVLAIDLSDKYDTKLFDILTIWRLESKFNPFERGKKGEFGIGQTMPETHELYGKGDFNDWRAVAETSVIFYHMLSNKYAPDTDWVITAYNAGQNGSREYCLRVAKAYLAVIKKYREVGGLEYYQ